MELNEKLRRVLPLLDNVKDFLNKETGLRRSNLALAEISESKSGDRWIITLFDSTLGQEGYYDVEVSKSGEVIRYRRLQFEEEAPRET